VKEFPDRRKLDSLFPGYPIFLERVDGHAAIVSQLALDKAGVKPGQELVGGKVETRDGRLTGILVDNATDLVGRIVPGPDARQMKDALMQAQQNCFAVGLTTIVDCGLSRFDVRQLIRYRKSDLKMRMVVMLSDDPGNYEYYLSRGPYKRKVECECIQTVCRWGAGIRGACLLKPYSDKPRARDFCFGPNLTTIRYREENIPLRLSGMHTRYWRFCQPGNSTRLCIGTKGKE
jgi:predicted amidohydrolase YtcJ